MTYGEADRSDVLHMELNTNLCGEPPVLDRLDDVVESVARYPSEESGRLRQALTDRHGLPVDAFVVTNGADAALDIAFRALVDPRGRIAMPWPSFTMYPYFARLHRVEPVRVPLGDDLSQPVDALAKAEADLLVLADPANPTGETLGPDGILELVEAFDGPVVIDEAYVHFADHDGVLDLVPDREDLVVVRTFSKAYGLAGMRVGYAAASGGTGEALRDARPPFHVNAVSEAVATAALDDDGYVEETVRTVRKERARLAEGLAARGFAPRPSQANFVLAEAPVDPFALRDDLADRGVLVRVFPDEPLLADHVRITVGRSDHTDRLLSTLDEVMA